jgi:hypothetical protein
MATYYEGDPIGVVEQTLTAEEYAPEYRAAGGILSPFHRRGVKAGLCLSAALLIGSVIPLYRARFSTVFGPICGAALCVAFAALFYFYQPREIERWAAELFRSNALLSLPQKISVYRDSVVIESEREHILEYWTDFAGCLEDGEAFVLAGGRERDLLVIKKRGLSPEQIRSLSEHFSSAFALRYEKRNR